MAAVDRALPVNRWWCISCPLSFPSEEDMNAHYTSDHPNKVILCTTCLNRFEDQFAYDFHASRGHYRGLVFVVVKTVFGDQLFNDVSAKEFHLLVRNGANVPPGTPWPLEPAQLSGYKCRSLAFSIAVDEADRKAEREAKEEEERVQKEREEQMLAKEREEAEKKRQAEASSFSAMFAALLGRFA